MLEFTEKLKAAAHREPGGLLPQKSSEGPRLAQGGVVEVGSGCKKSALTFPSGPLTCRWWRGRSGEAARPRTGNRAVSSLS